jgi:hypothetical protein
MRLFDTEEAYSAGKHFEVMAVSDNKGHYTTILSCSQGAGSSDLDYAAALKYASTSAEIQREQDWLNWLRQDGSSEVKVKEVFDRYTRQLEESKSSDAISIRYTCMI